MIRVLSNQVLPLFFALLSSIAISLGCNKIPNGTFSEMILKEINGVGIDKLIVFIALSTLFIKTWNSFLRSTKWITHLLAILLSAFMLIGQSYASMGNWGFIFANEKQFYIALVSFIGYFILFDLCLSLLYSFLLNSTSTLQSQRSFPSWIEQHYMLFAFCVIMICWLPYLIAYLPGSVPHDGYYQINMGYGIDKLNNHHPWLLSEFYGLLMWIGRRVSDNFGVFIIVFLFFIIEVLSYTFVCYKIKILGAPYVFCVASICFFSLLPAFGAYSQAVIKDGPFYAFFSLFYILYIDVCLSYNKEHLENGIKTFWYLFAIGLSICFTRNNGIHVILPSSLLLLLFLRKGKRRYAIILSVSFVLIYFCVENVIAPAIGVIPYSRREMLSIPFQQTARYVKEFPNDVTEEEKKTINAILPFDKLAQKYKPELSDPVKNSAPANLTLKQTFNYIKKAWYPMLLRHPGVYLESVFHNTFGYYYPFSTRYVMGAYQFYIKGKPVAKGNFDIHYVMSNNIRKSVGNYSEAWRRIPGLTHLINPGMYTWVLLIMAGFLCYCREFRKLLGLIYPALNVIICIVSPVNGLLRYAIPLMACTPILIFWCTEQLFIKNEKV